jgi:hypothetical protein
VLSNQVKNSGIIYRLVTLVLQGALVVGLFSAGWLIYQQLPASVANPSTETSKEVTVRIIIRPTPELSGLALDIPVEFSPVDLVAVRHEYFMERRAGKRFDDFRNERMNGRTTITAQLDRQGSALVMVPPGNWWVYAALTGEEGLEWRLPIQVTSSELTIELTPQNAYARTKSF